MWSLYYGDFLVLCFCFPICFVDLCFVLKVWLDFNVVAGLQTIYILNHLFMYLFILLIKKKKRNGQILKKDTMCVFVIHE